MNYSKIVAGSLATSLEATCQTKGLDVALAASRTVAERVLYNWRVGFGGSPFLVKGGMLFPQELRPTRSADLVTVVRWTEEELARGLGKITDTLRAEGIAINRVKFREISHGGADPVVRVDFHATFGHIRTNAQVNVAHASGPFAFPQEPQRQELPSLVARLPPVIVYCQPLAASAAEKWFAVLTQRHDDFQAKHGMDLLSFDEIGLDPTDVAIEMIRTARHRRIPLSECAPSPQALEWTSFLLRADSWIKTAAERRIADFDAWQTYELLNRFWARTHQALTKAVIADVRRDMGIRPSLVDRLAERQRQSAPYHPPQSTP
ncbi:nucleotidyl transferase AbiEii/AbiGii toxin family protein [Rhizobium ruizarguesonis]|uniref:nucleotidyl transferase AbiEii/AbiGii toxin family protein n=1 Tax=Rhizobium ruizarguesonis TaxID=2081791 RepID=UPI001030817D|nr:nucleotidyl transferase AbiEii/AbiGii toxin family protein [Rhizobium ruizarguesonis]TBA24690.1 hypothetical protein ELH61_02260 [Rhizobium ruizarguesonis]